MSKKERALRKVIREEIWRMNDRRLDEIDPATRSSGAKDGDTSYLKGPDDDKDLSPETVEMFGNMGFKKVTNKNMKASLPMVWANATIGMKEAPGGARWLVGLHNDNKEPILVLQHGAPYASMTWYLEDLNNVSSFMSDVNRQITLWLKHDASSSVTPLTDLKDEEEQIELIRLITKNVKPESPEVKTSVSRAGQAAYKLAQKV